MFVHMLRSLLFLIGIMPLALVRAGDAAVPGKLTEETPTLRCLGVRWLIGGDENHNAQVTVEYRKSGAKSWRKALDLFRVESDALRPELRPSADFTLYAGSIFRLEEATDYEVRLKLVDPDGGNAGRLLKMTTWSEPKLPKGGRVVEVHSDELADKLKAAKPGDILRLHAGTYRGHHSPPSGEAGKPVAITAFGDGEAILDGGGAPRAFGEAGVHDVIIEGLTIRNAQCGIAFNSGWNITIRRCKIEDVDYGFVAARDGDQQTHILLTDNTILGRSTWPRSKGIEDRRGVQISGHGCVVCYNRVAGFADAIDTFPGYPCLAIDFYGNEISECTDDGIEMDYSDCNTRCFENRLTNVFQGISVQPVHGGPVYVFRNALYNACVETFKMHNKPSGALFFHNTSVKNGMPLTVLTNEAASNCVSRNNLFLGTKDRYGYGNEAPMRNCDFDHDGFGGEWDNFLKWNDERYATMEEAARKAPVYHHAVRVDAKGLFLSGIAPPADSSTQFTVEANDLRLSKKNAAIDAGEPLPNINDNFQGKAPDLGAFEQGVALPHYGPR